MTTVTAADTPRWVTGTPAAAGAANADVTPGTTSKGTPASSSACASSPPRPNTNGSPPFSRTIVPPALGERHEQRADQLLGHAASRTLADVDQLGGRVDEGEHSVADEGIVDHDVGLGEQSRGANRQQLGVAWARANQMNAHASAPSARAAPRRRTTGAGSQVSIVPAPTPSAQSPNDRSSGTLA